MNMRTYMAESYSYGYRLDKCSNAHVTWHGRANANINKPKPAATWQ
jgi:hypothetical protein